MKKSIIIFISGSVFGILISLVIFPSAIIKSDSTKIDNISRAIDNLNDTTKNLQKLIQTYSYILPQQPTASGSRSESKTLSSTSNTTKEEPVTSTGSIGKSQDSSAYNENDLNYETPASSEQIDNYQYIETKLFEAANNHEVKLSNLIEESNNLTPQQRQSLTRKAMDMIKNGELKANQFTQKPDS